MEIIYLLQALRKKGIFILGVTENELSILAVKNNLLMKIKIESEADQFNMLVITSVVSQKYIDIVVVFSQELNRLLLPIQKDENRYCIVSQSDRSLQSVL